MITIEITTDSEISLKINGKEISLKDSSSESQPECQVSPNGDKRWYLNGELHRVDGPAIERADGTKEWWLNDKRHRVDGPAIEYPDGDKHWYLDDMNLNMEKLAEKSKNLSPEQKLLAIYLKSQKPQKIFYKS
jgi:hypothetical protein